MAKYLFVIYLFFSISLFPQAIKIGFGINSNIKSEDIRFQYGPNIYLEYSFQELPVSIQINGHFSLAERKPVSIQFMTGSYGTRLKYFPLKLNSYLPYLGAGVFYNLYNISDAGGLDINIHNNASLEISGGINSNPKDSFNFFIEVDYQVNNPSFESQSTDVFTGVKTEPVKGKYKNKGLSLRLGLLFEL